MTLIRAWIEQGRPKWSKPGIGSFEGWSQTIGGILDVVGVPGFQDNRAEMYERFDPAKDQWGAFVQVWFTELQMERVGVKDLVSIALRCDIINADDKAGRTMLGAMLRGKIDQLISLDSPKIRVRLIMDGKKTGAAQYRLCYGETERMDFEGDSGTAEPREPISAPTPTLVTENADEEQAMNALDDENREPVNQSEPRTTVRVGVINQNLTPTLTVSGGSRRLSGSRPTDTSASSSTGSSTNPSIDSIDASFEEGKIEEIGFSETAGFGSGESENLTDPFIDEDYRLHEAQAHYLDHNDPREGRDGYPASDEFIALFGDDNDDSGDTEASFEVIV